MGLHCDTVNQKKQDTNLVPITSPNNNRFSNFFFTDELGSKFENRLMFGEVMGKSLVFCFFLTHGVVYFFVDCVGTRLNWDCVRRSGFFRVCFSSRVFVFILQICVPIMILAN